MRWRSAIISTIAAAILWGVAWAVVLREGSGTPESGTAAITLGLDPAAVESITIESGDRRVLVSREVGEAAWLVTAGPKAWPGDDGAIRSLIADLAAARFVVGDGEADIGDEGVRVAVRSGRDRTYRVSATGEALGGSAQGSIVTGDSDAISALIPQSLIDTLEAATGGALLDRRLFGSSDRRVDALEVRRLADGPGPERLSLTRGPRGWRFDAPSLAARVDGSAADRLIRQLQGLRASAFVNNTGEPLTEPLAAIRLGAQAFERGITIGGRSDIAGRSVRAEAEIRIDDAEYGATVELDTDDLPTLTTDPLVFADRRIVPWAPADTGAITITTDDEPVNFERGIDGWRRGDGTPLTRGVTIGVESTLRVLSQPLAGVTIDSDNPTAPAFTISFTRLGGIDRVEYRASIEDGRLRLRGGGLLWDLPADERAFGWLVESLGEQ